MVNRAGGFKFESVTMSRDGLRLPATVRDASDTLPAPAAGDGCVLLSNDGGTTWTRAALPTTALPKVMRAVDSSADGQVIVAVSRGGDVFRSTDGGATPFALVNVLSHQGSRAAVPVQRQPPTVGTAASAGSSCTGSRRARTTPCWCVRGLVPVPAPSAGAQRALSPGTMHAFDAGTPLA